ncbi:hypothetical protein Tco_1025790 [Tanacetum coccineum]
MADLTFVDSHNMVAYLEKSEDNADFAKIVDFINASPIRKGKDFSRTVTPLFATMLIQPQADVGEGSGQSTESQHTPTTASPSHSSGPTTLVADDTVHEKKRDSVERATTTATSLDAEQDSGNINRTQSKAITNDPFPQGFSSGGSSVGVCSRMHPNMGGMKLTKIKGFHGFKRMLRLGGRYGHDVSTAEVTTVSVPSNVDVNSSNVKWKRHHGKSLRTLVKVKGKDQIKYDVDVAQRLKAELDEEARLEREREEEASKAANITEWDDVQAMMDAEKKHFEKLRAEEQRRKPPTKTQKRNIMSTYLKNIDGYKHTQLKNKSFEEIQMLFEKEMKRVNIFVDMDAELVKDRETREESDEEFVVHAIPLAVKPAPIIGFQIHRARRQGSYKIIRANGSTKTYTLFSQLIKEFDREDLENLWKLVKTKHGYTRPEESYERVLWGDLKVMFEPDVEDNIWRNLQGQKILL